MDLERGAALSGLPSARRVGSLKRAALWERRACSARCETGFACSTRAASESAESVVLERIGTERDRVAQPPQTEAVQHAASCFRATRARRGRRRCSAHGTLRGRLLRILDTRPGRRDRDGSRNDDHVLAISLQLSRDPFIPRAARDALSLSKRRVAITRWLARADD